MLYFYLIVFFIYNFVISIIFSKLILLYFVNYNWNSTSSLSLILHIHDLPQTNFERF